MGGSFIGNPYEQEYEDDDNELGDWSDINYVEGDDESEIIVEDNNDNETDTDIDILDEQDPDYNPEEDNMYDMDNGADADTDLLDILDDDDPDYSTDSFDNDVEYTSYSIEDHLLTDLDRASADEIENFVDSDSD